MVRDVIFGTIGGLGLFLFGMGLMSDGLKKAAGAKLKNILESMTKKAIFGCLVGAGITAVIQSSSATTVMVVGFVNAGLLTLKQAIPVIIGTNVGTTATAWLVSISGIEAFKITAYALPAVAVGFSLQALGRSQNQKTIGKILLGFGILFIGIGFMQDAFSGLEDSEATMAIFKRAAEVPILAVLAGAIITMLIQSSSAAVASIQLLALGGAFGSDWEVALKIAIPFILGSNIGTTITAQLASLGTNLNARRAAWAHTVFNVVGAFICFWFIDWIARFGHMIAPRQFAISIAAAHTSIKAIEAVIFLPLSGVLERFVVWMLKAKPSDVVLEPVVLEKHLLDTPPIALAQANREIVRMAKHAKTAVNCAIGGLSHDNRKLLEKTKISEDQIDDFQYEITLYLSELAQRQLDENVSIVLPVFLHTVNDLERVGDHAINIVEIAERKISRKLIFSDSAQSEVRRLKRQINEMLNYIIKALEEDDISSAKASLLNEVNLNDMQMEFRHNHVQRMTDGRCSAISGLIFIDLVDNVEKIGDHLTNIAQAVIGGLQRAQERV